MARDPWSARNCRVQTERYTRNDSAGFSAFLGELSTGGVVAWLKRILLSQLMTYDPCSTLSVF